MIGLFLLFYGIYIIGVIAYSFECWQWNDGISRIDGSKWRCFNVDSGGDRGYRDSSGNVIWISWPSIDKPNNKKHKYERT